MAPRPRLAIGEDEAASRLASARVRLLAARDRRVRPGRDDKILTSWNALMIGCMAHAARVFSRDDWLASARRALDFRRGTLWDGERLLATHKDGRSHLNAYLDDHAFLLAALLEVMQADFRAGHRRLARLGLSLDAWGFHPQLADVVDLARACPEATIVVCHVGGPLGYGPYAGKPQEVLGIFLGIGLGGFFDGILLHQVLQWHHMAQSLSAARTLVLEDAPWVHADGFWKL